MSIPKTENGAHKPPAALDKQAPQRCLHEPTAHEIPPLTLARSIPATNTLLGWAEAPCQLSALVDHLQLRVTHPTVHTPTPRPRPKRFNCIRRPRFVADLANFGWRETFPLPSHRRSTCHIGASIRLLPLPAPRLHRVPSFALPRGGTLQFFASCVSLWVYNYYDLLLDNLDWFRRFNGLSYDSSIYGAVIRGCVGNNGVNFRDHPLTASPLRHVNQHNRLKVKYSVLWLAAACTTDCKQKI